MKPKINIKKIMTKMKTTDFFVACKDARIENNTSFYGCFYIGPFDESLSQTLANDLRRTLLSELTGLAITSIEIEGVLHKFSSLPGMKESVLDLICNLQNIVLKKHNNTNNTKKTYTGFLNVTGPRVIKAIDLKLPSGLQCVDPNQYIATLAEDGFLNLKFNINEGKNFIKQKPNNLDVQGLKKRNILLQDANAFFKDSQASQARTFAEQKFGLNLTKEQEQNQNPRHASQPAEFALQTLEVLKIDKFNLKNKKENKEFLSNPIPLDAVFMPVTKINCIVEENNMYSDFSTDFQENSFNLKNLNKSIYIGAYVSHTGGLCPQDTVPLHQEVHNELSDLLEKSNVNNKKIKSDFQSFLNLINYNSLFQTFYLKEKQLNDFKLIPWHSNLLYFSFTKTRKEILDPFNKINLFLACKATSNKKSETNHKIQNLTMENLKKKIIKLSFKTKQKENVNVNKPDIYLFSYAQQRDNDAPDAASQHQYAEHGHLRSKQEQGNYASHTGGVCPQVFKINFTDKLIQNNMYLEYSKNLKIKPLRKKTHLIVEIWTNGSIHPRQALYQSFSFLSNVFLKLQTVKMFDSPYKNKIKTNYNYRPSNIGFKYSEYALHTKKHNQDALYQPLQENQNNCCAAVSYRKIIKLAKLYYLNKKIKLVKPSKTTLKKYTTIKTSAYLNKLNQETSRVFSKKKKAFTLLKTPISILPLSLRTYTALKKENILTLNELIKKSKKDLLKINNIGIKSLGEIETSLYSLGLALKI